MKRRSFLAMLGLAPVVAAAKSLPSLPDPIQLETVNVDYNVFEKAMKAQQVNFQKAVFNKLRSKDGKLEINGNGEVKIFFD